MYKIVHTTVFATAPAGGNPCPVVLDADGMTTDEMQRMTVDFGVEAVFVLKSEQAGCQFHLRYFVPFQEMTMCAHATIAAVSVLVWERRIDGGKVCFETVLGPVRAAWDMEGEDVNVQLWQFAPEKWTAPSRKEVCRALRIQENALLPYPVESWSVSRAKIMVPLKSRAALDGLKPDFDLMKELCERDDATGFYPFAMEKGAKGVSLYARQYPKNSGFPEDPATGVAAAALGAYLIENKIVPTMEGWNRFPVYQGQAMGRPSLIWSAILVTDGEIQETTVCGKAELLPGA